MYYDKPPLTELTHHGVLGQKWGVRRFQNVDGSLTKEGIRRKRDRETKNPRKENPNTILTEKNIRRGKIIAKGSLSIIGVVAYSEIAKAVFAKQGHGDVTGGFDRAIKQTVVLSSAYMVGALAVDVAKEKRHY